jgi:hypothetical protein
MRTIGQLRNSGTTRTSRRIALMAASFGVFAATLGIGAAASGRVTALHAAPHASTHTIAATSEERTNDYSGGRLMTADPNGGYWTVSWLGAVSGHGGAPTFGSPALSGITLTKPIVAMAATPDGQGYWLVGSDGGVFAYGDATFYGSTGAIHLNEPIVGMAATADGLGYWLVASDGGIFTYGDANFLGSTGAMHLNQPIVGMAPTPDGLGYWLVASDGGIFTYGDANFFGSTGAIRLNEPIVGMAPTPDGQGYWLVASDGGIFTFGDAPFDGSLGASSVSVLGIVVIPANTGYVLVAADGTASTLSSSTASSSEQVVGAAPMPIATPGLFQGSECQPTGSSPSATMDTPLDDAISNETGPGWIGGDATYSTQLPDGREAFVFSDTLIGTAQEDGQANLTGLIHNSELIGGRTGLSSDDTGAVTGMDTDMLGTTSAPQTLIPDTTDTGDQWQVAATYTENDNQLVFVNEFAPVAGSEFDRFTGHSGIAVLRMSADGAPTFSSVTPLSSDAFTQWGNAITQTNGFTYVYGTESNTTSGAFYGMKVARVADGESLNVNDWQYWNGSQWMSGEGSAAPINTTNELTGITAQSQEGGYVAVSVPGSVYTDKTVDLSYACSPAGPWTTPTPVYNIPQVNEYPDEVAYIPTFHPELSTAGDLVVSYNIDTTDGLLATEANVHEYQPQFLQLNTGS